MHYEVKLENFEGPLDLLLYLVNRNEVSILDIPIALITDQYLETLRLAQSVNLEIAGEYLLMASYLTQIKSACLLPSTSSDDPEDVGEDPRQELIAHLLEYKRYRDVSRLLDSSPLLGREVFGRGCYPEHIEQIESRPNMEVSLNELLEALKDVIDRTLRPDLIVVEPETLAIKDKIILIIDLISRNKWVTFRSLFEDELTRVQIVTTFLALLEVVKMGAARIYQDTAFGAILISRR
jgi:segregation and condensation protein A